jgi:vitamin B12 transporter
LKPEKSEGWEAGVEQSLFGRALLVGATYFDSTLHDEIVTDFSLFPITSSLNLAQKSTQKGVELFAQARIGKQWRIDGAYTNLDAKQGNVTEVRRADNIASVNLAWRTAGDRGGVNVNVRYNGEQNDTQFLFVPPFSQPVTLKAFTLVNLGADWRLSDKLQIYGRVENALDETYQEVFGYATAGRAAYVGLRAGF